MRTIKNTAKFKRDYKRVKKSGKYPKLDRDLTSVVKKLAADEALPRRYYDHALSGELKDTRDCHIKPDLVLIYRKPRRILELVRLGSHSQLDLT